MDLLLELTDLIKAFNQDGIDYALCGGLALAVYARPRATLDIDTMVESDSLDRVKIKSRRTWICYSCHADEVQRRRCSNSSHDKN
jgi:hypothetical protein